MFRHAPPPEAGEQEIEPPAKVHEAPQPRARKAIGAAGIDRIGEHELDSGRTCHNMRGFMGGTGSVASAAEAFDAWLREARAGGKTRDRPLMDREQPPGARQAQPHEDHLLPLMVAAGAASGKPGRTNFHGHALGKPTSGFRFG